MAAPFYCVSLHAVLYRRRRHCALRSHVDSHITHGRRGLAHAASKGGTAWRTPPTQVDLSERPAPGGCVVESRVSRG